MARPSASRAGILDEPMRGTGIEHHDARDGHDSRRPVLDLVQPCEIWGGEREGQIGAAA
jgi:hypothetical protein